MRDRGVNPLVTYIYYIINFPCSKCETARERRVMILRYLWATLKDVPCSILFVIILCSLWRTYSLWRLYKDVLYPLLLLILFYYFIILLFLFLLIIILDMDNMAGWCDLAEECGDVFIWGFYGDILPGLPVWYNRHFEALAEKQR